MNFKSIIFSLSIFTIGTHCSEQKFSFEKMAGHLFNGIASAAAIHVFVPKEYSALAADAILGLGPWVFLMPNENINHLVAKRNRQLYYLTRNKCGNCGEYHLKKLEELNARIKQHDQQFANTIAFFIGACIGSGLADLAISDK